MDYIDVFDHMGLGLDMSHGKVNDGLNELCRVFDRLEERFDPNAELFAKIDICMDEAEFDCCHLAIVKRSCTAAADARIEQACWENLGKVADSIITKVKRLECVWDEPSLRCFHAFDYQRWVGKVPPGAEPIAFDVSAPVQLWDLVDWFKEDITKQMEEDWATLTGEDGCVHFAYLQVLPHTRYSCIS